MAVDILKSDVKTLQAIDYYNSQQADVQERVLALAVENDDAEAAAAAVRTIRNRLLVETDARVALDRLDFNTDSATKFLESLKEVITGDWAVYRQELRDITKQEGFPFNVKFPTPPDADVTEDDDTEPTLDN